MGTALLKIKVMPESPDTDLSKIKIEIEEIIKKSSNMKITIEEEPIAFGLKALIVQFAIDESKSIDEVENQIKAIKHVSSTDIIDFRRAFG